MHIYTYIGVYTYDDTFSGFNEYLVTETPSLSHLILESSGPRRLPQDLVIRSL